MDASFHIRPFAFDRIFTVGAAEGPVRTEDLQLQIASLEAEVERMRAEHEAQMALARADGFEAGLAQARGERETALLAAVDALHAGVEAIDAEMASVTEGVREDATAVALAAAELLAARALAVAPAAHIDEAIGRVLKQVARGQEVVVRVHPDQVSDIERLIAVRQTGDRRRLNVHVEADETLPLNDARIEWDQGGLVLDAAARAAAVRGELEQLLPKL